MQTSLRSSQMRIGIDATCWQNTRGYGRHARALLSAMVRLDTANRYIFFLDSRTGTETLPPGAQIRLVRASAPTAVAAAASGHRSVRDMWRMSHAMAAAACDVLLFPTVYSYVPVCSKAKKVVMIHDIIAEQYPRLTLPSHTARLFWKVKVALGRWQADAIVTVSDYARQGILAHFKIAPERVFVVGEASDPIFRVFDTPRPTPYLEALGLTTHTAIPAHSQGVTFFDVKGRVCERYAPPWSLTPGRIVITMGMMLG